MRTVVAEVSVAANTTSTLRTSSVTAAVDSATSSVDCSTEGVGGVIVSRGADRTSRVN